MTEQGTLVVCQREDEFADMYPEFAPEPIVVRCERSATVLWEDDGDPEGQYEHGHAMVVCTEHAFEMMQYMLAHGEDFSCRALTVEDRNMFLAGAEFAEAQALSFRAAELAYHEGFAEAGLATPEMSPQLFDVGWEWAMAKRVQLLLGDEEAAEEARQEREDARDWEQEQRNGNLHGRNVL
jgi:hypothetical protein